MTCSKRNFRETRQRCNMSLFEVALLTNISVRTLRRWESGYYPGHVPHPLAVALLAAWERGELPDECIDKTRTGKAHGRAMKAHEVVEALGGTTEDARALCERLGYLGYDPTGEPPAALVAVAEAMSVGWVPGKVGVPIGR